MERERTGLLELAAGYMIAAVCLMLAFSEVELALLVIGVGILHVLIESTSHGQ